MLKLGLQLRKSRGLFFIVMWRRLKFLSINFFFMYNLYINYIHDLKKKFIVYVKENFNLLHNNTIKTISNTAKSSVLIVIVYHLKS